ncbi:nitroreductase family protein [Paenibacillus sp. IB182496]|uniref:Nitroreductase family protein n=1 Tax=Paenibacillus sabuli TaxID=2772509 RepID=A0A927GSR0_9BACL|nr:nitroreductase family protein [Paenibacillus sabuli]MBD2847019.1 nitroreductase family protein [Paenibacillus sabuli]
MNMTALLEQMRPARRFTDRPIAEPLLLELLNDAVWAPTHKLREAWRFIRITDSARPRLRTTVDSSRYPALATVLKEAPLLLIVAVPDSPNSHVAEDDFAAACCLIQNLQLLAWEQGIGMAWELADYSRCASLLATAQVREDERIAGVLGLGYFANDDRNADLPPRPDSTDLQVQVW